MSNQIKISNIFAYIQGKIRYQIYYSPTWGWIMRDHIREQITWRISVMDKQCYSQGSCKICGCDTTALQMADKQCPKPCYPKMMGKKEWIIYKVFRPIQRNPPLQTLLDEGYGKGVEMTEKDGKYEWTIMADNSTSGDGEAGVQKSSTTINIALKQTINQTFN